MPPTSPSEQYAFVATRLTAEAEADAQWTACRKGRWRSAISRAYYSVFLALKARLIEARPTEFPRDFPRADVHKKVREAVGLVLGKAPGSLAYMLRELSEARTAADYEWWDGTKVLEADVRMNLDRAERLCGVIDKIDAAQMKDIARELARIERDDREARKRRT